MLIVFKSKHSLLACAVLLFGGWISAATAQTAPPPLAKPAAASLPENYTLQKNDLIRITVYQEDDMMTETRISKSGSITFPLLGSVVLENLTIPQAVEKIRAALDKDYIIDPKVTLTVLEYAKRRVTVLGEVNHPGTYEMPDEGELDLLGAIAMAGGYTKIANPGVVTLRRVVDGKDTILKINAKRLASDKETKPFFVQPNDTITVAESLF
ncbi:MAG: polysaccharide biosynthesis/export family protein [Methylacidiphilales bacterium]|nr:polysaccharide biosynthesis/export family protein [Candidatus Methylacidiphilales bacterium]